MREIYDNVANTMWKISIRYNTSYKNCQIIFKCITLSPSHIMIFHDLQSSHFEMKFQKYSSAFKYLKDSFNSS